MPAGYNAMAERAYLIEVIGFDLNCPQHITPRFTEQEIASSIQPLAEENTRLRAEVDRLRALLDPQGTRE